MSLVLQERHSAWFDGRIHVCPLREYSTGFQLVDEFGDGISYAGLTYQMVPLARPHDSPSMHFDRLYQGRQYGQGDASL